MIKSNNKKYLLLGLFLSFIGTVAGGAYALTNDNSAFADTGAEFSDEFVITDTKDEVLATYLYTRLNETDCSVKITNKTVATKAVIPSRVEIDGVNYRVTEIAANGFASSVKLLRVSLPSSIKKINNMAFANCINLQRISLGNVQEIGNSAFYKCTSLKDIVIPKSVEKVGTTILRGNTTEVYLRAAEISENWSSSWNSGNNIQEIQFNSTYSAPLELETVYEEQSTFNTRIANPTMIGYVVAGGQPRTDEFYIQENSNIFIPNMYDDEIILGIAESAFETTAFDQLVIEYSAESIWIGSLAFSGVNCNNITINRNVEFFDYNFDYPSDNIFAFSSFNSIILPDTLTEFPVSIFYDCNNLANIYFNTPVYKEKREAVLNFINDFKKDSIEGIVYLTDNANFSEICESAFDGTTAIKELHIYSNIENLGPTVFSNWTPEQKVFVHNDDKNFTTNWHIDALSGLSDKNIIYDAAYYTISFNANGGTVDILNKEVKSNALIGELPVPEADYKVFVGWYDANNNLYDKNLSYTVGADITLTARWQDYNYFVKYNGNRPNEAVNPVVGEMQNSKHTYGANSILNENKFTIEGWHFTGWNTAKNGNGTHFADMAEVKNLNNTNNGTTTLYAQWARNVYSVIYNSNKPATASNAVTGNISNSTHTHGVSQTLKANTYALSGWHFTGWNTKPDGSGISLTDIQNTTYLAYEHNSTVNLYAQWQQNDYIVHYEPNQPKTYYDVEGKMDNSEHFFDVNSQLKTNNFSLKGWAFNGWNTKADGTGITYNNNATVNDLTTDLNCVVNLYAQWEKIEYKINYILNGGKNPNTVTKFTVDDEIVLLAPIMLGFDGSWSQAVIPIGTATDLTIIANYSPRDYQVDYYMNDGTDSKFKRVVLKQGANSSLEQASRNGYYFGGWKYNGEYITEIKNIQTDMALYAVWIPNSGTIYNLSASAETLTVNNEISIIELPNTYLNNGPKVIVTANVKQLIIHSDVHRLYEFYIEIESRYKVLDVKLLNFNLRSPLHRAAIGPYGDGVKDQIFDLTYNLEINLYGYNCEIDTRVGVNAVMCSKITIFTPIIIEGGSGSNNWLGGYPSYAIRADYVTVNSTYVSLYGGNGYESGGMEAVSGKLYFTKKVYEETALIVAGEDDNG